MPSLRTVVAKSTAAVFGYEAVALGFGPTLKRLGVTLPPLSDIAIKHPIGAGVLVGVLAFHLHEHYQYKQTKLEAVV